MPANAYPTVEQILNQARVYMGDTGSGISGFVGEGLQLFDAWPPTLTILNDAISCYERDLEMGGVPPLKKEVAIFNLPAIYGVNGPGAPDPAAFQRLGFDGFDPGNGIVNSSITLPTDLLQPLIIDERTSNTDLGYTLLHPAPGQVPSRMQSYSLGAWEWRTDSIYWNGALINKDIRLRYQSTFATLNISATAFSTTTIYLLDSAEPLGWKCAYLYMAPRVPPGAADWFHANYHEVTNRNIARFTRSRQYQILEREPYGNFGDLFTW